MQDCLPQSFKAFCRWSGVKTDRVYYTKRVNGFSFIVTGVEDCDFKNPYHSDAQFDWLEKELKAAVSEGKPVFVICHKPLEDLGDGAERMAQILYDAATQKRRSSMSAVTATRSAQIRLQERVRIWYI